MAKKKTEERIPVKNASGYYRVTFTYEGKRYTVRAKTQKDLWAREQQKREAVKRAVADSKISGSSTVEQWAGEWLQTYVRPRVRETGKPKNPNSMTEKTYLTYTQKLENHILYVRDPESKPPFIRGENLIPLLAPMKMEEVRPKDLQKMLNNLSGASDSTIKKVYNITRAMFQAAFENDVISSDPSKNLKMPAGVKGARRAMTDTEVEAFEKAASVYPEGLWFRLLLGTGLRPGEAMALTVEDFNFQTGWLNVDKAVESGTKVVTTPKTAAGIRQIPIPGDLLFPLQATFAGKSPKDLAFTQRNGITMKTESSVKKEWAAFHRLMDIFAGATTTFKGRQMTIEQDGFEKTNRGRIMEEAIDGVDGHVLPRDLTLYCLRHTFCTRLQQAGVDLFTARLLMGHESAAVTDRHYTHSNSETLERAARLMDSWSREQVQKAEKTG